MYRLLDIVELVCMKWQYCNISLFFEVENAVKLFL